MLSYCSVFCLQSKTLGHTLGFLNHGLGHSCICTYCICSGLGGPVPTPTELYMLLLYTASPSLYGCTVRWHMWEIQKLFFFSTIFIQLISVCVIWCSSPDLLLSSTSPVSLGAQRLFVSCLTLSLMRERDHYHHMFAVVHTIVGVFWFMSSL